MGRSWDLESLPFFMHAVAHLVASILMPMAAVILSTTAMAYFSDFSPSA